MDEFKKSCMDLMDPDNREDQAPTLDLFQMSEIARRRDAFEKQQKNPVYKLLFPVFGDA